MSCLLDDELGIDGVCIITGGRFRRDVVARIRIHDTVNLDANFTLDGCIIPTIEGERG